MALTCTYKSSGYGSTFNTTDIEIIGSSTGVFRVAEGGVTFSQVTDEGDQHARWNGMRVEFTILIEDSNNSALNTFISDITSTSEEKFFVKVSINSSMVFMGILSMGGSEWADDKNAREFRISAYDGMGRLEGKDFADETLQPFAAYGSVEYAITKAMSKIGTGAQYGATPYLLILHSSVADGQTVTGNPMSNQRSDFKVWHDTGNNNIYAFKTAREVMEDIMIAYGLCLRYIGPHYMLYEPELWATGGNAYAYDASGSYIGTQAVPGALSLDNSRTLTNFHRDDSAGFSALPPYHRAHIKYDHGDQITNLLYGVTLKDDFVPSPNTLTIIPLGNIVIGTSQFINLRFSGKLRTKSTYSVAASSQAWRNHRYHFKLYIKVENSAGTHWWTRDTIGNVGFDFWVVKFSKYTAPTWETGTQTDFDFITDIIDRKNADLNIFHEIGFDTLPLTTLGVNTISFGFILEKVFDENVDTLFQGAQNPVMCEWELSDLSMEAVENGAIIKRPTYTDYERVGEPENADFWSNTTHIGDGPTKTSVGRLQALVGGEWKDTATWGGVPLLEKTVKSILKSRSTAVELLTGGGYSIPYWFDRGLSYGGKTYIPMSVEYESGTDHWTGRWVEFKIGSSGGTTKISVVKKDEIVELPKNPNKLPDDERLEDRITEIITGTERYLEGDTYTELELREAAETDLWNEGDQIWIKDPAIGYSERLTVAADVKKGDTAVEIEPWTPNDDFPPGSYLILDTKYSIRKRYYAIDTDFSGTEWTITGWDLPDPTKWSVGTRTAEIRKRLAVTVNGQKKIYLLDIEGDRWMKGFTIDVSGVNNKIIFLEAVPDRSVVEVIYDV